MGPHGAASSRPAGLSANSLGEGRCELGTDSLSALGIRSGLRIPQSQHPGQGEQGGWRDAESRGSVATPDPT